MSSFLLVRSTLFALLCVLFYFSRAEIIFISYVINYFVWGGGGLVYNRFFGCSNPNPGLNSLDLFWLSLEMNN